MKLRAKLTLGSVALATILVTIISAVGLISVMQLEFRNTLERAEMIKSLATDAAINTLNQQRSVDFREAVRDPALQSQFVKLLTSYKAIVEISLVSADPNNEVFFASALDEKRVGAIAYPPI